MFELAVGVMAMLLLCFCVPMDGRRDGAHSPLNMLPNKPMKLFGDYWHWLKKLSTWPVWLFTVAVMLYSFFCVVRWYALLVLPFVTFYCWRGWTKGMQKEKRKLAQAPWRTGYDDFVHWLFGDGH